MAQEHAKPRPSPEPSPARRENRPPVQASLKISLFGSIRLEVGGDPAELRSRTTEWLLALLALRGGRPVDRSWLVGTLWLDSEPSQALKNLRNNLSYLRAALGPEGNRLRSPSRETVVLDLGGADVDALRFDESIRAGDRDSLRSAVDAYSAPLLQGCNEEWAHLERESRAARCIEALERLAELEQDREDHTGAIAHLRRAEALDPLRDSMVRRLMISLDALGDRAAAADTYRQFRTRLHDEMLGEPSAETTALFQEIRGRSKAGPSRVVATASAPLPALRRPPHPLTELIGREAEVAHVRERIRSSRLVTLVGTGGVGKTRLAIEVAHQVSDDFAHGAIFVELAEVSDPALLPANLASAFGLREDDGAKDSPSLTTILVGWLSTHDALLVLDNCEHLIENLPSLTRTLLEHCPNLRILATSRQRLGLPGESICRVPSLPFPKEEELEQTAKFPAVRLFAERAVLGSVELDLSDLAVARAVARICRRLDGIPLAIELAAARVGPLTIQQIQSRLDDRFRLLTKGSSAALPRQQTLRASIDWSYEQLEPAEKSLLCSLSVFVGGWTLEAAEAMGGDLDTLTSLADKSLLIAEVLDDAVRYRMLETVREYAVEKLAESGDEVVTRNRHLAWCLASMEAIREELRGPSPQIPLDQIESEAGNVRGALAWAQTESAPDDAALRLTAAIWPYWETRAHHSEGREHMRAALDRSSGPGLDPVRAEALLGAAALAFVQEDRQATLDLAGQSLELFEQLNDAVGSARALILCGQAELSSQGEPGRQHLDEARRLLERARLLCDRSGWKKGSVLASTYLGLAAIRRGDLSAAEALLDPACRAGEDLGDPPVLALALHHRGLAAWHSGQHEEAISLFKRRLIIWRAVGHGSKVAFTLEDLGMLARLQGNSDQALSHFGEAVAEYREQGNPFHLAAALQEIGGIHYRWGDFESARPAYAEALDHFTALGSPWGINGARMNLASTLFHTGAYEKAMELHRASLAGYVENPNPEGATWALERIAVVEAKAGDPRKAAVLLGISHRSREKLGQPMQGRDPADWEQAFETVRLAMGEPGFNEAWLEGRSMEPGEALRFAGSGGGLDGPPSVTSFTC